MSLEVLETLRHHGLLPDDELETAAQAALNASEALGSYLVRTYPGNLRLLEALERAYGAPWVDLSVHEPDGMALSLVHEDTARRFMIVPIVQVAGRLAVAMQDPLDLAALDYLRSLTSLEIEPLLATRDQILDSLNQFALVGDLAEIVVSTAEDLEAESRKEEEIEQTLLSEVDDRPVVRLVNTMLRDAVNSRASDIHLEPGEHRLFLRYRVDGVLYEAPPPPLAWARAIVSRIKILGFMDIAERRLPQDGRCVLHFQGRQIDLRISILPCMHGEGVVIRLLDRGRTQLGLEDLGMDDTLLESLRRCVSRPNGIVLVTGPTGSGKSTTLYSVLESIRTPHKKIVTLEDPVEYTLEGVFQVPVRSEIGLTFARCLRSVLRHDPDIIMVGEIRDSETAEMAVRAALTGHVVLSTLHTNDALSAITRLVDLGVPRYLVADTLRGSVAQRLVRRLCPDCRVPEHPDPAALRNLDPEVGPIEGPIYQPGPGGCASCGNIGFRGRIGVYEFVEIDPATRDALLTAGSDEEFKSRVHHIRYQTMRKDGLRKVLKGLTSLEAVTLATVGR